MVIPAVSPFACLTALAHSDGVRVNESVTLPPLNWVPEGPHSTAFPANANVVPELLKVEAGTAAVTGATYSVVTCALLPDATSVDAGTTNVELTPPVVTWAVIGLVIMVAGFPLVVVVVVPVTVCCTEPAGTIVYVWVNTGDVPPL